MKCASRDVGDARQGGDVERLGVVAVHRVAGAQHVGGWSLRRRGSCCPSVGGSYRESWGSAASANGLPSESRQTAHRSPGWMTDPPSSRTRSRDARQVVDREVGEGGGIAGPRPTLMDPEAKAVVLDLPSRAGVGGSRDDLDVQHAAPETASAVGVVSGELDQRDGHRPEYAHLLSEWPASPAAAAADRAAGKTRGR